MCSSGLQRRPPAARRGGADKICATIADESSPGSGATGCRAFLGATGANIDSMGGPEPGDYTVGAGGGYGGIYCFALIP